MVGDVERHVRVLLDEEHGRTGGANLAGKTQPGALYKALSEDREIAVGLQARMQAMSDRTFQALSIGLHTGLLLLDPDHERHLVPGKKSLPVMPL